METLKCSGTALVVQGDGWTFRPGCDPEAKREHDFNNWLQEIVLAAAADDSRLVTFCSEELRKAYREANRRKRKART